MIEIIRTDSKNVDFLNLVSQLDEYLKIINGSSHDFFNHFNKLDFIKEVVILYENNVSVRCGAMEDFEKNTVEIKRMFVNDKSRSKGYGTLLLNALIEWAQHLGYHRCVLETSNKMPEAIQLYTKNNFKIIPNYGQYKNISSSICFEKNIFTIANNF